MSKDAIKNQSQLDASRGCASGEYDEDIFKDSYKVRIRGGVPPEIATKLAMRDARRIIPDDGQPVLKSELSNRRSE